MNSRSNLDFTVIMARSAAILLLLPGLLLMTGCSGDLTGISDEALEAESGAITESIVTNPWYGPARFDMGPAAQYAVLGLDGTFVNLHNVSVTGDVGVGPSGSLNLGAPSSVSGDIQVDATAKVGKLDGKLGGSCLTGLDLSSAVAAALSVSEEAAGLALTQPAIKKIGSSMTIAGNGGLNVLSVEDISLDGDKILSLDGGPNDLFVLNVTGELKLGGHAQIVGSGNVGPAQVLINVIGEGARLTSKVDNYVSAILLAPHRQVEFHSMTGQVIAGGKELKLMSGAEVKEIPADDGMYAVR